MYPDKHDSSAGYMMPILGFFWSPRQPHTLKPPSALATLNDTQISRLSVLDALLGSLGRGYSFAFPLHLASLDWSEYPMVSYSSSSYT